MRFFKSNQPLSAEDEAAAMRLAAVATRTKAARTINPTWGDEVEPQPSDYEPVPVQELLQ